MMRKTWLLLTIGIAASFAPRPASAQMWFEADALFWGRDNSSEQPYVTGGANSGDADFDFESGYRFIVGGGIGNYELEASYLQIDDWNGTGSNTLGLPLALDGTGGNVLVFPGGAATLAFPHRHRHCSGERCGSQRG